MNHSSRAPFVIECQYHSLSPSTCEEWCSGAAASSAPEFLYLTITTPKNKWDVMVPREKMDALFDSIQGDHIKVDFGLPQSAEPSPATSNPRPEPAATKPANPASPATA